MTDKPPSTSHRPSRSALWLLALAAVAALGFGAYHLTGRIGGNSSNGPHTSTIATLVPASLPRADATLTRIALASCLHQARPQPILDDLIAARPELLLMLGDNVYGDFRDPDAAVLRDAYAAQARHPQFLKARRAIPMLATWDDHDYGLNDGGAGFAHRIASARLFHEFWSLKPQRPLEQGIYYSRVFGPPGKRVQIIMLDTRSFRSDLTGRSDAFPHWGRYQPSAAADQEMLGTAQWNWLEAELRRPAEIRLIGSSIQVLAEGHGWERWGNLPAERERLMHLIDKTGARGLVLLSGDRHAGALYSLPRDGRRLFEITSSSLNLKPRGPNRDSVMPPLVSDTFIDENFGLIAIDWAARSLEVSLVGIGGRRLAADKLSFADLGL